MPRLKAANFAQSTLSAELPAGADTMTVVSGDSFPDAPFRVMIGDEIIEVEGKNGNTFSPLLREREGTNDATHIIGSLVQLRWTAGMYDELDSVDHAARHQDGGDDELDLTGLDGISTELASHVATYDDHIIDYDDHITDYDAHVGNYDTHVHSGEEGDAPNVPWANVDDKPTEFAPAEHDNSAHDPDFATESALTAHLDNEDDPHTYEDVTEDEESDYHGVKYKLVVDEGVAFLEVVEV